MVLSYSIRYTELLAMPRTYDGTFLSYSIRHTELFRMPGALRSYVSCLSCLVARH